MKRLAGWEAVGALFAIAVALLVIAGKPETKDYISYWSAGQQLHQHADPYSAAQVFALEKSQGYTETKPLVMRNPPWSLFLVLPLGWISPRVGLVFWVLLAFGCMVLSLALLQTPARYRGLAYVFTPFLICLITGQSSCFLLLGLATFLAFHRSRPWIAGAALLLMASKPHVFFLFWPLLLCDCILRRRFRILLSGAAALLVASCIAWAVDPQVWSQYLHMLRSASIHTEMLPTPSFLLRRIISIDTVWLQLIPSALALVWAAWFYARNRRAWDWSVHLSPVLFICILTSPYVWMTDEVVLLPAILLALACAEKRKHATAVLLALNTIPFAMLMIKISLPTGAYVWTSAAWLAWYLYTRGMDVLRSPVDRFRKVDTAEPA